MRARPTNADARGRRVVGVAAPLAVVLLLAAACKHEQATGQGASPAGSPAAPAAPAAGCSQPIVSGPCKARIERFGFDPKANACVRFSYGGCQGNENNFETREACEAACGAPPPEPGREPPGRP